MNLISFKIDAALLDEHRPHYFNADASELGFPVAWTPSFLDAGQLGNGLPFFLVAATDEEFRYEQQLGCATLTVYRD